MRPPIELPIILVISDNKIIIAFLKKTLKEDYYPLLADSKEETLDILQTSQIDLIIVDEDIQKCDPFTLAAAVRKGPSFKKTPMLLITSSLKKTYTDKALKSGYTDFLNEPLDENEIYQRLRVALSSKLTEKKMAGLRPKDTLSAPKKQRQYTHAPFFSELAKAKKLGLPVCLLVLEEDNFQQIVEDKGKTITNKLLKLLETSIKGFLRPADMLFMQKDGSFLLLLPKTSGAAGKAIAEAIRQEISEQAFSIGKEKISITFSIGLVHYEDKAHLSITEKSLFERLLDSAHQALEIAKKKGNRTALLSTDEEDHYEVII